MDNIVTIITAICAAIAPLATIITAILQSRATAKNAAKQSILQMILEDQVAVMYDGIPENYQNILDEYDTYHKNGGNSYLSQKVEAYKKWYVAWQAEHIDKKSKV